MQEEKETTLTMKTGVILVAAVSIIVFMVTTIMSHNSRITVLETNYTHVCSSLNEIKGALSEIQKLMNNRGQAIQEKEAKVK